MKKILIEKINTTKFVESLNVKQLVEFSNRLFFGHDAPYDCLGFGICELWNLAQCMYDNYICDGTIDECDVDEARHFLDAILFGEHLCDECYSDEDVDDYYQKMNDVLVAFCKDNKINTKEFINE